MAGFHDFRLRAIDGSQRALSDYRGKVCLVVNVASKCGLTPQYDGLQRLYDRFQDRGLEVLGFPCNQFGKQEPGDALDIAQFCERNFGVSFPLFRKIEVNGPDAHPLFVELKKRAPGILGTQRIKWNFTKFLVDPASGKVTRYAPNTKPEALKASIEALLSR